MASPTAARIAVSLIGVGAASVIGSPAAALNPAHTSAAVAHCELRLAILMSPPRPDQPLPRSYHAPDGSLSCTGALGPWLTAGQPGWANSEGTVLRLTRRRIGKTSVCMPVAARGSIFAVVPRMAWFHPPRVTLSGSFRVRQLRSKLELTGHGQLVPTPEAPIKAPLSLTGSMTYIPRSAQPCNAKHLTGTLSVELVLQSK